MWGSTLPDNTLHDTAFLEEWLKERNLAHSFATGLCSTAWTSALSVDRHTLLLGLLLDALHDSTSQPEAFALGTATASNCLAAWPTTFPVAGHTLQLRVQFYCELVHLKALHDSRHGTHARRIAAARNCLTAWATTLPIAGHARRLLLDALHDSTSQPEAFALGTATASNCLAARATTFLVAGHALRLLLDALHDSTS